MKLLSTSSIAIVVIALMLVAVLVDAMPPSVGARTPVRRFGFGFVDIGGLIVAGYSPAQFYNGMFKTPPYPSTWMAGLVENPGGNGTMFVTNGAPVRFLTDVMHFIVADNLDVKIVVMVGTDVSQPSAVAAVVNLVNYLASLPSRSAIGGFGWKCEQTSVLTPAGTPASTWDSAFASVRQALTDAGWPTINYYPQGFGGTLAEAQQEGWINHTNFPGADPVGTLDVVTAFGIPSIGITHGGNGPGYFVDSNGNLQPNLGCQNAGWPKWQNQRMSSGYLPNPAPIGAVSCAQNWPAIIDYIMTRDNANPLANRQWDFWIAGSNSAGYYSSGHFLNFPGVSGKNTSFLWDSAVFRGYMWNWLQNNPNTYVTNNGTTLTSATALSCSRSSAAVGSWVRCRATVTGSSPTGKVTWVSSGSGRFFRISCRLYRGGCSVSYTATSASSPVAITASYDGDSNNPPSFGTYSLEVTLKTSKAVLTCRSTTVVAGSSRVITCKAKVIGYLPAGTVTWSQSGDGSVMFASTTCTLLKGRCSVTMTGTTAGRVSIKATYEGDLNNTGSSRIRGIIIPPQT